MYDRPEVSRIFLEGAKRLGLPVLAGVSDVASFNLVVKYGHSAHMIDNSPLGSKWNEIATIALDYNWSHLFVSGDDNLYHNGILNLFDRYQHHMFAGLRNITFVNPIQKKAISMKYKKNPPIAIGTGRLINRVAFIEAGKQKEKIVLWDYRAERELDFSNDLYLLQGGYMPSLMDGDDTLCIDLKTGSNIWSFENFASRGESVDYQEAISWLGDTEKELISNFNA